MVVPDEHAVIPHRKIKDRNMTNGEFRVWCLISLHTEGDPENSVLATQKQLADELGVTVQTIRYYLRSLMESGHIEVTRDGNHGNSYRLTGA